VLKGRDGGAGELHGITAKLEEGLSWIGRSWGGLPTVSREVAGEELERRWWIQRSVWNASARESEMEGGEAIECFIPARKGGEARTGARHDDGKVAAGQNVAEPPDLFRLKCTSHRYTGNPNSMHFKRNSPLVCRVTA
jgi:hypothetical protein